MNYFSPERIIGSVNSVNASSCVVNLPEAANKNGRSLYGNNLKAGVVGEFVVIEMHQYALLGKIITTKVPESERLSVNVDLGQSVSANPLGIVQLLASFDSINDRFTPGLKEYPRIGAKVYAAHPDLIQKLSSVDISKKVFKLGEIPEANYIDMNVDVTNLVGRHCVILGTTGGGKSWTTATIVEGLAKNKVKTILLDPTGEYHTISSSVKNVYLGDYDSAPDSQQCFFPYTSLEERDLFAIFQPSSASQIPKLKEAIASLKLAKIDPTIATSGMVLKAGKDKTNFEASMITNGKAIVSGTSDFDISLLSKQIVEECVWPQDFKKPTFWGGRNDQMYGYNISLISRIDSCLNSNSLDCLFDTSQGNSFIDEVDKFLKGEDSILRVSAESISFENNAREITANAIGRYLLKLARQNCFKKNPVVVIVDEAHQFMDKSVGDEISKVKLDSFSLIAKEGRKYGLNIILTTQRSRDISEGVLSQIGTFIVHRLINESDIRVVEKASGEVDGKVINFLPTLSQGEAIVLGVDFNIPLTVKIHKPTNPPKSEGPKY